MQNTSAEADSPTEPPGSPHVDRRPWLRAVVIAVGLLIVAGVALIASVSRDTRPGNTTTEAFDLPGLNGAGRVRLADFKGQPTVVNFFASWCSACDLELPGYAKVSDELRGRVHFVGVDTLETGDPMFMPKRHNITWWPLAHDIGGSNGSGLHESLGGGNNMPITAFYDAKGKLLAVDQGALPESSLRARLRALYGV